MRSASVPPPHLVAAVAAGGAIGGSARTWLYLAYVPSPGTFPWVTLVENVTGAFALGLLATVLLARPRVPVALRAALTTGLLGGYTTFAGLSMEVRVLLGVRPLLAGAYLAATLLLGVGAAAAGMTVGRALGRRSP